MAQLLSSHQTFKKPLKRLVLALEMALLKSCILGYKCDMRTVSCAVNNYNNKLLGSDFKSQIAKKNREKFQKNVQ